MALNSRSVVIKTKTADKKEVTDAEATTAAMEMVKKIKDKFKGWVWNSSLPPASRWPVPASDRPLDISSMPLVFRLAAS